jgi:Spy/CpxP family protein refolding chaperone
LDCFRDVNENEKKIEKKQEVMMTKKVTILFTAVLIFVSMSLLAQHGTRGRDMVKHARYGIHMAEKNLFPGSMLLKFKDEIGLTAEQVGKIEKMTELFHEAAIKKQAEIKIKGLKVRSYLKEEQVDRKKMEIMIREIAKMKTDMQVDHMNYLLDLKDLLTPEQIAKIESLKKERIHKSMKNREYLREKRRDRGQTPGAPRA